MQRRIAKSLPKPIYRLYRQYMRSRYHTRPKLTQMPRAKADAQASAQASVLECCIAYNEYGGYCIPLSSAYRPVPQRILAGEVHELRTIQFIIAHAGDGDIVHAGSYFGDFLPALSNNCAPNAKIWTFEPNDENYRCSLITIAINDLKNVELARAGLGEQESMGELATTSDDGRALGGLSHVRKVDEQAAAGGGEPIHIVAVDEVVPETRRVSVLHLDVEGFEKSALIGALKTIRRCLPYIIVERLPDEQWLAENLFSLGYQLGAEVQHNAVLIPPQSAG